VGIPATRDKGQFPSRRDLGIPNSTHIHFDIGGEGYHLKDNQLSGFSDAINLNETRFDSQFPDQQIQNLVLLEKWETSPPFPVGDGFVNRISMMGTPLAEYEVDEIARILRPGGVVGLWINADEYKNQITRLGHLLNSTPIYMTDAGEFKGQNSQNKTVIYDFRPPVHDEP